jgi:hypothetical protein
MKPTFPHIAGALALMTSLALRAKTRQINTSGLSHFGLRSGPGCLDPRGFCQGRGCGLTRPILRGQQHAPELDQHVLEGRGGLGLVPGRGRAATSPGVVARRAYHTTARPKQTSPQGDGSCTAGREVGDLGRNEKLAIGRALPRGERSG